MPLIIGIYSKNYPTNIIKNCPFRQPTHSNQPTHYLPEPQAVLLPTLLDSLLEILPDHEPAPVLTYSIIMMSPIPADAFD